VSGGNRRGRETKRRILVAAAELFDEGSRSGDPFAGLELKQIAERVGLERNGLLHHFPTKEALTEALARHLLSELGIFDELDRQSRALVEATAQDTLEDAVAQLADLTLRQLDGFASWNSQERLMNRASGTPELVDLAAKGYFHSDHVLWSEIFGEILRLRGRQVRAPFTSQQVGAMVQALLEGSAMRQRVEPGTMRTVMPSGRTVYAEAVLAILEAFTEPVA
jgi:AcrR family transcriptional regulator